ncbi:protein of unknown function [Streptomyces sp. 2131.1]|uniref:DUF4192 domain-containing protein n=1 Tax=Streptomyces sp. 2131.1 TaxID=1855346 RepID=UPI00089B28C1|nr:DUF4192 domain-containing protein [Streptomyces sp. 2131.1]SEC31906.1 protein of unknown function [Streptomyces sp. 2131.1]
MNKHPEPIGPSEEQQITLRGPAELADALPYLMGFHPNDSVVMVALHGGRGRFGGRLRLGIPQSAQEWPAIAEQLAECLIKGSERRGERPDAIVLFLCQDPVDGETGNRTMERLRPFAQRLRTACGALDVPVLEALCISGNRFWSYVCPDARCCPAEGNPLAVPGTSVMAAAATYAGIQVRGSLREMEARLAPLTRTSDDAQLRALDSAGSAMVPLLFDPERRKEIGAATLKLARRIMDRLGQAPPATPSLADINDDRLITDEEAASVILGLQDRETRDKAAEWMEGTDADAALRLWRALARRCVGPYEEHAAAPLTLAGWVSWSTGDEPAARVALGLALRADPHYTFAQLLHEACNQGLDPETLRRCLRGERGTRTARHTRSAERVAGARSARVRPASSPRGPGASGTARLARVRPAGRARTRSVSTRPGPGAAGRRRTVRPGTRGRRGIGTGR